MASLESRVVFVGDRPSRLNKNKKVAFVGAKCYNRLVSWISTIQPKDFILINSHTNSMLSLIKNYYLEGYKIVALGNLAATRLCTLGVPHHKLPHPSGLNRKLNNKQYVISALKAAKHYINSGEDL